MRCFALSGDVWDVPSLVELISKHKFSCVLLEDLFDWQSFFDQHLPAVSGHTGAVDGTFTGGPHGVLAFKTANKDLAIVYSDNPTMRTSSRSPNPRLLLLIRMRWKDQLQGVSQRYVLHNTRFSVPN